MDRRTFLKLIGASAAYLSLSGCLPKITANEATSDESENMVRNSGEVQYRILPHGGAKISTIGLGSGALGEAAPGEIDDIIALAAERGINIMDTVMSDFAPAYDIGRALKGRRDKFYLQMHIGAIYPSNVYTRAGNLKEVKEGFEQQLKAFNTDYCDFALLHYIDDLSTYNEVVNGGLLDYAQQLKKDGTVRGIGFSSHSVEIARKFLETGLIDLFMFSINPAYDFGEKNNSVTINTERRALYEEAQKRGAGITVMKAYGGSRLLSNVISPFGKAMTPIQCIHYALERPGVVSCLPGIRNINDLKQALAYYGSTRNERDYSFILGKNRQSMEGVCIYCGHCQPCSAKIDIAMANKYYDLAKVGDNLAKEHYLAMEHTAKECILCGLCEPRCPCHVQIRKRMKETLDYFGK
jgi:predicted aldo/keto reductase-like oxidoreductase